MAAKIDVAKMDIEMGIHTRSQHGGGGPRCSLCNLGVKNGEGFLKLTRSWRSSPTIHYNCIVAACEEYEDQKDEYKTRHNIACAKVVAYQTARKAKMKAVKDKQGFKKSIIKDALKTVEICVSKISITNPNDWGVSGTGSLIKIGEKNVSKPYIYVIQEKAQVTVVNPINRYGHHETYWSRWNTKLSNFPRKEIIELADPKAIEKIGKAIERLKVGDWSAYLRKPRKKK